VDKTELFAFGKDKTANFSRNLMVSKLVCFDLPAVDLKKDVVSVFPDCKQPHLIHACSMDRSISTYDLKQEKRINWRQIANGTHYAMT
jgi:hypothetical protein